MLISFDSASIDITLFIKIASLRGGTERVL